MTRARELLGEGYDEPAVFPAEVGYHNTKFAVAKAATERLKGSGDSSGLDLVWWEMALLRYSPARRVGSAPYAGMSYDDFAAAFGVTDATSAYAVERVGETSDIVLKLHYEAIDNPIDR